jgi:hypothetical protein
VFFQLARTGGGLDASPGSNEFVVSAGILGPTETFTEGIEAVGKLADASDLPPIAASRRPEAVSPPSSARE